MSQIGVVKEVFRERTSKLQFVSMLDSPSIHGNVLSLKGKERRLTDEGAIALYNWLGIPKTFTKKTPTELQELVVNWLLAHPMSSKIRDAEAVIYEDMVIGFKSMGCKFIPGEHFIDALCRGLDDPLLEVYDFKGEAGVYSISVVTPSIQITPRVGDIINGGVKVEFSDLGVIDTEVAAFTNRLVCTNGMVHQIEHHKIPVYDREAEEIVHKLIDSVQYCKSHIADDVSKNLTEAANHPVNSALAIARICRDFGLNQSYFNLIMSVLPAEDDNTLYGVIQAITRAANYSDLTPNERDKLRTIAGEVTDSVQVARCSHCFSVLVE